MRRTGITLHTAAELSALTTIIPQLGDQVMITDLAHAVFKYIPGTATADGQNVIVQNDGTNNHTWVRAGLNLIGAFNVPYTAQIENTTNVVEVSAVGVNRDAVHLIAVVSGMPASANGDADIEMVRASATDKLAIQFANNTGAALTAGTLNVNVFRIGG